MRDLTKLPFMVEKPVLRTIPKTGLGSPLTFLDSRHLVPEKRTCLWSFWKSKILALSGRACLIMGIDSPVSILSFMIQVPKIFRKKQVRYRAEG